MAMDIRYEDNVDGVFVNVPLPLNVTVMLYDQAYGGPEEGGWYYDTGHRIEHHYCATIEVYQRVMDRLGREYDNEGRYPISSVLSDGLYCIHVGQTIPENFPNGRPHYE